MRLSLGWVAVWLTIAGCGAARGQAGGGAVEHPDSRVDVYGGYGYFHPGNSGIDGYQYHDVSNPNATVSVSGFFTRYLGLQLEGGYFSGNNEHKAYFPGCAASECDQLMYTAQAGPVFRLPLGAWTPFVHMLGGGARYNGPVTQSLKWGWGVTGGVGVDYEVPGLGHHLAVRPVQVDFQYAQDVYGPLVVPAGVVGGFGEVDALKLSGGLVVRFGDLVAPRPAELGCSAEPTVVHPGEPVVVQGSTLYLNPRVKPVWRWTASGGVAKPDQSQVTVDTTGLAPGDYVVEGHVRSGRKPREQAACTVPFAVRERRYDPPSVRCVAEPGSVVSGAEVAIAATGLSPQGRKLTYSYAASAGVVTGNGPKATLETAGLGTMTVEITCSVADDLGQKASFLTKVTVAKPEEPVIPQTEELCSLNFTRDQRRPVRVDNEAKGCLDDIALRMNNQTDARLVMIGNASPDERPEAAAQRVLNARQYLVQEKGIEAGRIEVRVGETVGRTVRDVLVPSGASFSEPATQLFEERAIQRPGEAYGTRKLRHPHVASPASAQPGTTPQPAPQ